jgi:hypothetical protein
MSSPPPRPQWSPDGRWWWDGTKWVPAQAPLRPTPPPSTPRGTSWGPIVVIGAVIAIALLVVVGVVALIVLSANSNSSGGTPSDVLEKGYISQGSTYLMFVQFDSTGSSISGTLYQAQMSPSGSEAVSAQTFPFTGSRQGDVLVLNVALGGQWSATLSGSTLRLRYTDVNGLPEIATFSPSSLDAYTNSVTTERTALAGGSGCTVEYPNHNATISISGTFSGQPPSEVCAEAVNQGYVVVQPDPSASIVCVVGAWGVNAVVVRDTGGQVIGTQICKWVNADHGPLPTWASTPANFY